MLVNELIQTVLHIIENDDEVDNSYITTIIDELLASEAVNAVTNEVVNAVNGEAVNAVGSKESSEAVNAVASEAGSVEDQLFTALLDKYDYEYVYSIAPRIVALKPIYDAIKSIDYLNATAPEQRTTEWFTFRNNLITASNIYKVFGTPSEQNQLICEKCLPQKPIPFSEKSAMHHGNKYEPVTAMLYEQRNGVKVSAYGCIPHTKYSFLGASPDGIVTDIQSPLYGRMLEFKNPVSRDITGVIPHEYWIQMQIQMEVCNLPLCDYMETRFIEYDDEEYFYEVNDIIKGVMLQYQCGNTNELSYDYMPIQENYTVQEVDDYVSNSIELHTKSLFIRTIYWRLVAENCVTVKRDVEWFASHIDQIQAFWNIILEERITGCEHRLPKSRKSVSKKGIEIDYSTVCLL